MAATAVDLPENGSQHLGYEISVPSLKARVPAPEHVRSLRPLRRCTRGARAGPHLPPRCLSLRRLLSDSSSVSSGSASQELGPSGPPCLSQKQDGDKNEPRGIGRVTRTVCPEGLWWAKCPLPCHRQLRCGCTRPPRFPHGVRLAEP